MADFTLLLETADLRNALAATKGFTNSDVDDLSRIRVHATEAVTTVSATNGSAAAVAAVSTWSLAVGTDTDDDAATFDLDVVSANKILRVFKGKAGSDGEPGEEVRIDVAADTLTITDCSGMFEGQQLVLPRLPMLEHATNPRRFLAQYLHTPNRSPRSGLLPLYAPNLALFHAASKVYATELVLELHDAGTPTSRGIVVVRCGEDFIGALIVSRWDEGDAQVRQTWRDAWARRLPAPLEVVR